MGNAPALIAVAVVVPGVVDAGYGCEWSYSYAVADVVNACRAFRASSYLNLP